MKLVPVVETTDPHAVFDADELDQSFYDHLTDEIGWDSIPLETEADRIAAAGIKGYITHEMRPICELLSNTLQCRDADLGQDRAARGSGVQRQLHPGL